MIRPFMIAVLFAAAGAAQAEAPTTVFGIELGAPLVLQKCKGPRTENGPPCAYIDTTQSKSRKGIDSVWILFGFYGVPGWVHAAKMEAQIVDGKVERVWMFTSGLKDHAEALGDLQQKFGKPTRLTPMSYQNGYGAKFEAANAEWSLPALTVQYEAVFSGSNEGTLSIETDKGRAAYRDYLRSKPSAARL